MVNSAIPTSWLRGMLDPLLLALLTQGEAYGYELSSRMEAGGFGRVPGGSLYPALLRLEKQELLVAEWRAGDGGPGRKYYRLTPAGTQALVDHTTAWESFASCVSAVFAASAER